MISQTAVRRTHLHTVYVCSLVNLMDTEASSLLRQIRNISFLSNESDIEGKRDTEQVSVETQPRSWRFQFVFDKHLSSSQSFFTVTLTVSLQIDEISILSRLSTPQPFLSCFPHLLAVIVMKFAEVLTWIKTHQRPFTMARHRPIERRDESVSPGPRFRGLFSCHFWVGYWRCM